ncbi:putative bifunctional diguanylate cyclase/phosphodiesterase [Actinomarinicola tropica]|uniref:EAL domain-containing protein n=1 Tax=Actinomarinicola tropica TaxID=2789776 RepID=A0A5Q2RM03_9ACTN|nr:bifunctional diguanylate cyclase/phosphodiesterase [Actinomarinicola tropica]QGG95117.1 EAL domain-containing protein [Actinomarinicola tropica]
MDTGEPLSKPAAYRAAFEALVEQQPSALVSAVSQEGIFLPLPAGVQIDRTRVLHARSALDLVVAEDRQVVIDGWFRVREAGGARIVVHLASAPEETAQMHFFDLQSELGAFFVVLIPPAGVDGNVRPDQAEGLTSRVTWTKKSDNALFVEIDPGLEKILGWAPADLVGERALNYIHPDDEELAIDNWMTMLAAGGDGQRVRLRHLHKNGDYVWVEIANRNLLDDPDDPHVIAQMIDISDEMQMYEALREREQLLHRLAEALPSGLLHVRADGEVVYTNERLHEIVGVPRVARFEDQVRTVARDDWPRLEVAFARAMEGIDADLEVQLRLPGVADARLCHLSIRSLTEADGTVTAAIVSVSDVTEAALLREELRERAMFDSLTRCHNRAAAMQILEESLATPGDRLAVVFIDLDRFKAINDELGHAAGDELLVVAADRLRSVVRGDDVVGRIGGDEFLVVCPKVSGAEEAIDIAERVAAVMRREVELHVGQIDMRASVGVAWTTSDVVNADDLVARADAAMYESKRRGVGRPVAFAPALRRSDSIKLDDERALHHALERGDLVVHFQPIVRLDSGAPIGFESLVRWSRGSYGVAASEFIEMAEETGLIHELGTRVRTELVRNATEFRQRAGDAALWFANVSTQELQMPGIVDSVTETIDALGLPRESFVVEFRCNVEGEALDVVTRSLCDLAEAGLGLALDDFGTGAASPDLLRAVPLSWVKLASSFTTDVVDDPATARIVESLLGLSAQLAVTSIVKGVETEAQRSLLVDLGADLGQGHLFAAAAPLSTLLRMP